MNVINIDYEVEGNLLRRDLSQEPIICGFCSGHTGLLFCIFTTILPETKLGFAAVAGIASHNIIFIHGEWHMQAAKVLCMYLIIAATIIIEESSFGVTRPGSSMGRALQIICTYCMSLFISMVLYRTLFHRLRKFPGPSGAAISKFWHVVKCLRSSSQNHLILDELHKQYGDFVRTGKNRFIFNLRGFKKWLMKALGPNEITVFHPDIFAATDGLGNTCGKAVWYDFLLPELAVNTIRDKVQHDQRRRIWDKGFTRQGMHSPMCNS